MRHARASPLGRAWGLLDPILTAIRDACPEVERIAPTGSFRRFAATVGELEALVASTDPARTSARLLTLPFISTVLHAGRERVVLRFERAELTIRIARPDAFVPRLVYLTGSPAHVSQLRRRAATLGLSLTPDGLMDGEGRARALATEDDLYAALDLAPVPPELREGAGRSRGRCAPRAAVPAAPRADSRRPAHAHGLERRTRPARR